MVPTADSQKHKRPKAPIGLTPTGYHFKDLRLAWEDVIDAFGNERDLYMVIHGEFYGTMKKCLQQYNKLQASINPYLFEWESFKDGWKQRTLGVSYSGPIFIKGGIRFIIFCEPPKYHDLAWVFRRLFWNAEVVNEIHLAKIEVISPEQLAQEKVIKHEDPKYWILRRRIWHTGTIDTQQRQTVIDLKKSKTLEIPKIPIEPKLTQRDIELFYQCRSAVLTLIEDLTLCDQVMVKQMRDSGPPIPRVYYRKSKTQRATELQETGEIKDIPFFDTVDVLCAQGMDETETMGRVITELAFKHQMVEWFRCCSYQGQPYWNIIEVDPGSILPLWFAWKKIIVPALGFILDFFASYGLGENFFEVYYTGNKSIHTDSRLSIKHPSEVICSVAQE